ncbi:DHA2 family efflux MFS transporter permease subunit [Thiothrix litoralis]|uniref:DHA2 family efflux MFS transporter permease subunit n=1 Tax=Thiothrix litoralis TaxID=2891210 RepID=A0ABX7WVF1_9GAMM|nr:DHA2 family efflux MFS transporter permease subunit [Thiothrix litoralis]QTR47784.1 DHA2 family efflux MFS transporter permease subunit [Thiothrix litoralis]
MNEPVAYATSIAKPGVSRGLISITVMLTTIMVILDMTIVNVALPDMMGALGATSDQITWVLTSYIVAEAIMILLTGFLVTLFGRKRLMLVSVAGFIIASALCGQADNLAEMIVFRLMQGICGASVIPLSQSVMVDVFPKEERGKAMAFWGIGIMLGPILGPTLGGYITEHLGWRWVFYINLPVGILNLLMVWTLLQAEAGRKVRADWLGALFMAVGIGSLQLMLDQGNQKNWFDSGLIQILAAISIMTLTYFVIRSWQRPDSIVKLDLLKDRNLATSCFMMFVFGLGMFGTIALQPIMLENLLNYNAQTTGLVMAPRGLASMLGMFLVSRLINRVDLRLIIFTGFVLSATGTWMLTQKSLQAAEVDFIWNGVVQGLGLGMIFVPLSTLAYETLQAAQTSQAAGIYNLSRTIGSSVGISVATAILSHADKMSQSGLSAHITASNPAVTQWLATQHLTLNSPQAISTLASALQQQALMVAFNDTFWVVMLSFVALAPLLLLIRRPSPH